MSADLVAGLETTNGNTSPIQTTGGAQVSVNAWKWTRITASGAVAGIGAGNIFGGIMTQVVGTSTTLTVYDDTSTTAARTLVPVTATATTNIAGAITPCAGSAVSSLTVQPNLSQGVVLQNGLYVTVGGTGSPAFLVFYR